MSAVLEEALKLAWQGLRIFPCRLDKHPTIRGWQHRASCNPDDIRWMWAQRPGELIGVLTGAANGFDAIDIDPRSRGEDWLRTARSQLPPTRVHYTRSGGWHLLFRHHPEVRNSSGRLAQGVDVRGQGGFVIWWPAHGMPALGELSDIAEWPAELLAKVLGARRESKERAIAVVCAEQITALERYAAAALSSACSRIAAATIGQQEHTLNSEALGIGGLVKAGALPEQLARESLVNAAMSMANDSRREPWRCALVREKVIRAFRDASARVGRRG